MRFSYHATNIKQGVILMGQNRGKSPASAMVTATKESRSLIKVRESIIFQLSMEVLRSIRFPPLIILLPYNLPRRFFSSWKKKRLPNPQISTSGVCIIAADQTGDIYANIGKQLIDLLAEHPSFGPFSFITTGDLGPDESEKIHWYRLPPPRELSEEPKNWNIMAERLISSALAVRPPRTIVFIGNYLFRGVADALIHSQFKSSEAFWFQLGDYHRLDKGLFPEIERVRLPNPSMQGTRSVHRIINHAEDQLIFLVDISSETTQKVPSIYNFTEVDCIVGIERGQQHPEGVALTIEPTEIDGYGLSGRTLCIIDDQSPLVPTLSLGGVPTVLIRTEQRFSAIEEKLLQLLELDGSLIVLRNPDSMEIEFAIEQAISNFREISEKSLVNPRRSHPMIEWLKTRGAN